MRLTKEQALRQGVLIRETVLAYKDDFFLFCKDFLGYKDMNSEHKKLCDKLQYSEKRFKLVLMPRYSFKSCVCTAGTSLWRLMKDPNLRILIYSDAIDKAKGFLTEIKNHIEGKAGGSKFRKNLGAYETDPRKDGKWNDSEIVISTRYDHHAEHSIEIAGIETSKVGKHYNIIIFDDIVSDKNITTKEQMDKVKECYKKSLSMLVPGGEIIMIGTIWHFNDLYRQIIAENKERETFEIVNRDAEEVNDEGKLIFEDIGLTKEFLDFQKSQQGSYIYSCLYRNNPVDQEDSIFKTNDFCFYNAKSEDLYITGTIDPAGEGGDYTGLTVVGTDHKMNMYILESIQRKMSPSVMIETIMNLNYKYRFKMFGIETIFFRNMLKLELERVRNDMHAEDPKNFPMFGIHEFDSSSRAGRSKFTRIMALQPYHEGHKIFFPGDRLELLKTGFSDLAHQMLQFTPTHMPEPNDLLDSLSDHITLVRHGGVVKEKEPPRNSAAWLEKQWFDEHIERNNRLPRRFRRILPRMAFN